MKVYEIIPIKNRYISCINCIAGIAIDTIFGIDNVFYVDDLIGGIQRLELTTYEGCCETCLI
jgi:hypothetical protein